MSNSNDCEIVERKEMTTIIRKFIKDLLKEHGFDSGNSVSFRFKTTSPFFQQMFQYSDRYGSISAHCGRRLVFPLSAFNKTMDHRLFKQLERIGSNAYIGYPDYFCNDTLRYEPNFPKTYQELELFKQKTVSFFKEEAIPFYERYQTIEEYLFAYESQLLTPKNFSGGPLRYAYFFLGLSYYAIDNYSESLRYFQLANNQFLADGFSEEQLTSTVPFLQMVIQNLGRQIDHSARPKRNFL